MAKNDAFSQIRTDDLLITSEVPYQLGHKGRQNLPGVSRTPDLKITITLQSRALASLATERILVVNRVSAEIYYAVLN